MTVATGACNTDALGRMLARAMTTVPDAAPLEQAMSRFAAGQDAALGDVYDLAAPAVFTFLLRICRDRAWAEDLTQETFLRIHRARGLYREGAAVMPWAYTIARRLFLDAVRARRREGVVAPPPPQSTSGAGAGGVDGGGVVDGWPLATQVGSAPSPGEILADRELARAVDDALARIPETQAAAFRLLKGEGLSLTEAAAVMGTTRGAVKLRAHRAYEALRGILGGRLSPDRELSPVRAKPAKGKPKAGGSPT